MVYYFRLPRHVATDESSSLGGRSRNGYGLYGIVVAGINDRLLQTFIFLIFIDKMAFPNHTRNIGHIEDTSAMGQNVIEVIEDALRDDEANRNSEGLVFRISRKEASGTYAISLVAEETIAALYGIGHL